MLYISIRFYFNYIILKLSLEMRRAFVSAMRCIMSIMAMSRRSDNEAKDERQKGRARINICYCQKAILHARHML